VSPRINNSSFDDATNAWLREHADDLKGIEGARHLKPNPIEEPLDEDKPAPAVSSYPACRACLRPIFEEFADGGRLGFCARKDCKTKRLKLEKEYTKAVAKAAAKTKREQAVRDTHDLKGSEFRDAVDDTRGLAHKVFVEDPLERAQEEEEYQREFGEDLNTSSTDTEIDDEEVDEVDEEDEDEEFDDDAALGEDPEGTTTSITKAKPKPKPTSRIRADGEGLVPTAGDFCDDDVPLLVRVRKGYRPPQWPPDPERRGSASEPLKSCEDHGVAKCPTCFPESDAAKAFREQREKLKALKDAQEEARYLERVKRGEIIPPPKNEDEALEQEAARILKERLEKEEMAKRKIVRKRRPKFKPKETENLRRRYKFTTRQVADVLDIPLFNEPFQVLNRSLLYDPTSIFHRWYMQLEKNKKDRGLLDIRDARRRGDARYEDYTRWQTEWEVVDGKPTVVTAEYVRPEFVMIHGVAHFVDPVEADALAAAGVAVPVGEKSPADPFITEAPTPNKIKRRIGVKTPRQKSPSTYGEMVNMLPYKRETMLTTEERSFYKDLASRNMTRKQLEEKYGEKTDDEILLLENRAIKWAIKLRLLEPPLEEFEPDWERKLDEDIEADKRMISKSGGASIGGRVHAGRLNRYGKTIKLNSFRTAPIRQGSGYGDSGSEGRWSPDSDDYGEDSAA
jgi:hypothetical protein